MIIVLAAVLVFIIVNYDGEGQRTATASSVVISEVMSSNKGAVPDGTGAYPDWIELHNNSQEKANIGGFGLSDDLFEGAKYVFPAGTFIEPNGYIVVFCSGESTGPLYAPFKLSATDSAVLFDTSGNVLDSLDLAAVDSGLTLARDASGSFVPMRPSPGFENSDAGIAAYEGSLQSAEDIGVYINEFMASNATTITDRSGAYSDWMELYNANDHEVDLSGFGISDTLNQPMKATLPAGTVIPAKGFLLIFCSGNTTAEGDSELHVPFSLRAYEEDVVLTDTLGRILDSYSYTRQDSDASMARVPDGTGEFSITAQPTPGYPNTEEGYRQFNENVKLGLKDVYMTEIMGANASTLASNGEYYDWIELHNGSSQAVPLGGYALSDNPNNPAKWVFPDITLDAGEYLVVYASGLNVADAQKKNDLHLNFSVASDGETVFLFDPSGSLVDKLSSGEFLKDVSYGRNDADERFYYTTATPGAENGTGYAGVTARVAFSTLPGVYESPQTVELNANPGETVHYTTDCTTPTASSPVYSDAIAVDKNTVIRAVATRDGYITGDTVTGTFLFTSDGADHALPIATIVAEPDDLWSGDTGIYAFGDSFDAETTSMEDMLLSANFYKGKNSEKDQAAWERPANFAIFGDDNRLAFSQNVGIRIAGSYGRSRAQKGFNIIARDEYGDNRMAYKFFADRDFTEYKSLVLRAGAQDQNYSKIRDEFATGILEGTDINVLIQAYKPYVLYLNGEYWGTYFLKEKRSRFFVAQHEGLGAAEDMDIVKSSSRVTYGSAAEWDELMAYVKSHDLSGADAYNYVADRVDLSSFTDYMITEIWCAQTDTWNVQYYKLDGGKWKWIYYDFCWSLGASGTEHGTLAYRREASKPMSDLFNALLKNGEWRDQFIRRFAELMNTVYTQERMGPLADELYGAVQPEIERERAKFNQETFMGVKQLAECLDKGFERQIEKVRDFIAGRNDAMKKQLQQEFGLSDAYMQEVFS